MAWIWRLCITNMKQRGIRTFLTILGVIIGVISIVSLIALGKGATDLIMKDYEGDVLKQIEITSLEESSRKDKMITDGLIEDISEMDHVEVVYPMLSVFSVMKIDGYDGYADIYGVSQEYLDKIAVVEGTLPETGGIKPQLVFGQAANLWFFDSKSGVAIEQMEDDDRPSFSGKHAEVCFDYTGDGATKYRLNISGTVGTEYDYNVYCEMEDLKTFLKRNSEGLIIGQPTNQNGENFNEWIYQKAIVQVEDPMYVDEVVDKLESRGFQAYTEKEYADSMTRILKIAQVLLAGIGMIALLVAVIGISNTMMTAVYDRIHEIGILKVLGCDPDELLYLFLLESGILGAIGGLLGVACSYLITNVCINKWAVKLMKMDAGTVLAVIPWWLAVAAVLFAIVLGVVAGYFPARWAAKLRPIEAVNKQ